MGLHIAPAIAGGLAVTGVVVAYYWLVVRARLRETWQRIAAEQDYDDGPQLR